MLFFQWCYLQIILYALLFGSCDDSLGGIKECNIMNVPIICLLGANINFSNKDLTYPVYGNR